MNDMAEGESANMEPSSSQESPLPAAGLPWYRTLVGKVAAFMVLGVVFAYSMGALLGLTIVERSAREQWAREALVNAQIVSATIRRIYTNVAVRTDSSGQVTHLVSEQALGDEDSVLSTGFSPVDVLALASAQTRHNVWLFSRLPDGRFSMVADAHHGEDVSLTLPHVPELSLAASGHEPYVGFAWLGHEEHFISALPIVSSQGELWGVSVASIGTKAALYHVHHEFLLKIVASLGIVLLATALLLSLLMHRLFKPVPRLIKALTHISHNRTEQATPYTQRQDEIGCMAQAIEALRKKVVERELLLVVKEEALKFQHLAHHDALTKLPNRVQFNDALRDAVAQLPSGERFNVMIFDLDRFKAVNDTLGHAAGDELLVQASRRVQQLLAERELVARLGGDEFAILQPVQRHALDEASVRAGRLVAALREPFDLQGERVQIGVSIGIALAPRDGESSHTLLRSADVALYAAKAMGRGRYQVFSSGMTMGASYDE